MEAIYRLEGARAHTSKFAGGPWNHAMQHGSAPASLIAYTAEHMPTLAPMRVARITIDLMRPVPIAALDIETAIVREARKLHAFAFGRDRRGVVAEIAAHDLGEPVQAAREEVLLRG